MPELLEYDNQYWENLLGTRADRLSLKMRLHLIFSLVIFLHISVAQLITFAFTSEITAVRTRAARFMGYTPTAHGDHKFPPAFIFQRWYESFPNARRHLDDIIKPYAYKIAHKESDNLIKDKGLRIKIKNLTLKNIQDLLQPSKLQEKYQSLAPFTWEFLYVFTASPNKSRKQKQQSGGSDGRDDDEDWCDDPNIDEDETPLSEEATTTPEGFSRNPHLVISFGSMLAWSTDLQSCLGNNNDHQHAFVCAKPSNKPASAYHWPFCKGQWHELAGDNNAQQCWYICGWTVH